jgi:hypothetical protein
MIERAGVDVQSPDVVAEAQPHGLAEQPTSVALSREFRKQADESELALATLPKIEFEHADVPAGSILHDVELDIVMLDDRCELLVRHDEARKPEPRSADPPEKLTILCRLRLLDAPES